MRVESILRQPFYGERMVASVSDDRWPERIAQWLAEAQPRQSSALALPASRFFCLLDEQPTHLVPTRMLADNGEALSDRVVRNPDCVLARDGVLPAEVAPQIRLLEQFTWESPIAWARDPATRAMLPFWLGSELAARVENISPNTPPPASLSPRLRAILQRAGILVQEDQLGRAGEQWKTATAQCARMFQANGYAPVAGLIHPFHIGALRRYYRHRIRTGTLPLGDHQSPRRYVAHNESVACFFHQQLTSAVSALAGEPVKPSYVYLASYLSGAELEKHIDREQCEFSISLCLDYSPEPLRETPWPLRLETSARTVAVFQAIGDGLLYRGAQLPHYRDALPEGHTSTSIFFHYVSGHFDGRLD